MLFGEDGQVAGSTLADGDAATLARAAGELLNQASGLGDGEVTQIEASTPDGNVFVVREGPRRIAATTGPDPTTGLVFYDLKSALRDSCGRQRSRGASARRRRPTMRRKALGLFGFATGLFAGSVLYRRTVARRRERVDVYFEDGSMITYDDGSSRGRTTLLTIARDALAAARAMNRLSFAERSSSTPTSRATSSSARASGRATTSTSTASRRGPTSCARSASASRPRWRRMLPTRHGSPRPSSAPSRSRPQRRSNRDCRSSSCARRRRNTAPATGSKGRTTSGECVCLVEDVVTSGGALLESVDALREAGLIVQTAVCVVDRQEGGADALARRAVRLRPIFTADRASGGGEKPRKTAWLSASGTPGRVIPATINDRRRGT